MNQLYKMARDCLDRGHDIFTTAKKEQRPLALFRLATPSPTMSPTLPSQQFPSPHPPHAPTSHLTHSTKGPPQNSSKYAPQNQGAVRTGRSNTLPDRNMSWPRGGGFNSAPVQVRGHEAVDGMPGGPVGRGGGMGRGDGRPEQHHSQTITG